MNFIPRNILFAAAVVTILNFTSCKKYEDGPGFSLKSKKGRLTGDWELVKLENSNGDNYLEDFEIEFEFDKDGDFKLNYESSYYSYYYGSQYTYNGTDRGEWEFDNNKKELEVDLDGGGGWEFEIKRLTSDELWLEDQDGNEWEFEAI